MCRLAPFLEKYHTIIFDMDGVITSEQNYWNCAALTVYEFLNSDKYFGNNCMDMQYLCSHIADIRNQVFCHDRLIVELKNKGINSNWDLAYIVISLSILMNTADFDQILQYECNCPDDIMTQYDDIARKLGEQLKGDCSRNSRFWKAIQLCFQEWFLGDALFRQTYGKEPIQTGKHGLIYDEQPLIAQEKLTKLFYLLHENGKRICTGTGRPREEILEPLLKWKLFQYISNDGFINYSHVEHAEGEFTGQILTKPHPYMFLKALYGENYSDWDLLNGKYDIDQIRYTLIVGDAGADIRAAHRMGADFCAVLTGITGQDMRRYFEKNNAEYICNSIEDFLEE